MEVYLMAEAEKGYLRECLDKKICPKCGKSIQGGAGIGSGKIAEGLFCSLDCNGENYKGELIKRHKDRLNESRKYTLKGKRESRKRRTILVPGIRPLRAPKRHMALS